MFLFNRNATTSHSRKLQRDPPYVDRQDTTTPSSLSSSDGMPLSDHRRAYSDPRKRTSIFSARSRSKTDFSSSSSFFSTTASSTAPSTNSTDFSSRRTSRDGISLASSSIAPEDWKEESSSSKWFFSRPNRKLRKQNSKYSLPSMSPAPLDGIDESDLGPSDHVETANSAKLHGPAPRSHNRHNRKRNISGPFNFQHVTHTDPKQYQELQRTSGNELASNFNAVRASQAPRKELRGIRAQDLHFPNFSSDAVCHSPARERSQSQSSLSGPTLNGQRSREVLKRDSPSPAGSHQTFGHSPHSSTSTASIRAQSRSYSYNSPIVPPPRTSSRQAFTLSYDAFADACNETDRDRQVNGNAFRQPNSLDGVVLSPRPATSSAEVPHAVTTPDDSALYLKPPAFGSAGGLGLSDVPEEEESSFSKRNSKRSSRPGSSSSALRQTRSLGDIKAASEKSASHSSLLRAAELQQRKERPVSQISDTLEGPYCTPPVRGAAGIPGSSKRLSVGLRAVEGCWEDDIDYCYEHAVEADCDYDWDRTSDDEENDTSPAISETDQATERPLSDGQSTTPPLSPTIEVTMEKSQSPKIVTAPERAATYPSPFRPSLLVPSYTPSLDPLSASTNNTDIVTPASANTFGHSFSFNRPVSYADTFKESDGFTLSPSLLIPPDFQGQMLNEASYEDLISHQKSPILPFGEHSPVESRAESTDGNQSPPSKRNTKHGVALSRSHSIPNHHRSANSAGSLPELIPGSRTVREEFDQAAEQLADQIASLNTAEQGPTSPSRSPSLRRQRSLKLKGMAQQAMLRKAASSGNLVGNSTPTSPLGSPLSASFLSPTTLGEGLVRPSEPCLPEPAADLAIEAATTDAETEAADEIQPLPVLSHSRKTSASKIPIPMPTRTPPHTPRTSVDETSRIPSPVNAPQSLRNRAQSDAAAKVLKKATTSPPSISVKKVRVRSSTGSANFQRNLRSSYALFPAQPQVS